MKLSYNWLKEYVRTDLTPEELADKLTMSGSEVEQTEVSGDDRVFDLEITSNRSDCLSILGLAREVAALTGNKVNIPSAEISEEGSFSLPCFIEAEELCQKYVARVIRDVEVRISEKNMKERIEAVGMRSVNNIVDVTNYCLMENGQPLHAFDLDKLKGGRLIVRRARKGETIVTIDDEKRALDESMLVIADDEKPVAIAGIMGGKDTEVTENTKNIVLESAYFSPAGIRATARKLGLSSDSSYRFERGVDRGYVLKASDRAAGLIKEKASGRIGGVTVAGDLDAQKKELTFFYEELKRLSGIEVPKKIIHHILESLGLEIKDLAENKMTLIMPTFREDIRRSADIVEEILRIYGFDKVPARISKMISSPIRKSRERQVKDKLRELLPGMGLNEIMSYSLINEAAAGLMGKEKKLVKLTNPLSEEQNVLTPHLLDGMFNALSYNLNRQNNNLAFFEIGKRYLLCEEGYSETELLSLGLTGNRTANWHDGEKKSSFYHLKGIIEEIFDRFDIAVAFKKEKRDNFSIASSVEISDRKEAGFLGKTGKAILEKYGIEQDVFFAEIDLGAIFDSASLERRYSKIPRFPSVSRDISILVDERFSGGDALKAITKKAHELLREVSLTDVYRGEQIPEEKKSLTFSIKYGHNERTLTDEEVDALHASVKHVLKEKFSVSFR